MAGENYNQLRADVGLVDLIECTSQENERFAEMEKNGSALPEDICKAAHDGSDGNPRYFCWKPKTQSEKEELYVLMRISKDLRFIKVLLVLSIIVPLLAVLIGKAG